MAAVSDQTETDGEMVADRGMTSIGHVGARVYGHAANRAKETNLGRAARGEMSRRNRGDAGMDTRHARCYARKLPSNARSEMIRKLAAKD